MAKPITDKAEVALEYPDKLYVGTFERSSRFEAHLDPTGIALILEHPGAEGTCASRFTCTSISVCSPIFCTNWLRQSAVLRRMMSCIAISSREQRQSRPPMSNQVCNPNSSPRWEHFFCVAGLSMKWRIP